MSKGLYEGRFIYRTDVCFMYICNNYIQHTGSFQNIPEAKINMNLKPKCTPN